jgi:hypothetical protein
MDVRRDTNATVPTFLDILVTLPIEDQRAALAWLRQVAEELGCPIIDNEIFVTEKPFDFMALIEATRSFN